MPDVTFFCYLPAEETDACDDLLMAHELKEYKKELEGEYDVVFTCLSDYPDIFKPESLSRRNFMALYA